MGFRVSVWEKGLSASGSFFGIGWGVRRLRIFCGLFARGEENAVSAVAAVEIVVVVKVTEVVFVEVIGVEEVLGAVLEAVHDVS